MLDVASHPHLDLGVFRSRFPRPIAEMESPPWLIDLMSTQAEAPLRTDDAVKAAIRDLLRHGGYKPTGRGKPASEYLLRIAADGMRSINLAVDACNVVSLHSGIPISVVDLDRVVPPLSVGIAEAGSSYVFNPSGQSIDVSGLLCLHDGEGPCANGVKDSQRTKTHDATTTTLTLLWGTRELPGRTRDAVGWYREILEKAGADTEDVD